MKKDLKLYNVLFPFWFLILLPPLWLIVLPGNFLIDSLVLIIAMKILQMDERKSFYKKSIFKIYLIGLFSDIVGSGYMLLLMICEVGNMGDEPIYTVPAILISAILIYFMNYYISFKNCDRKLRFKLALTFAIATAPYTFLIPTRWLYGY